MAKNDFCKDGFSLMPRDLSEDAWFYEGKAGLTVVARGMLGSPAITVKVPWRKLAPAIQRYAAYQKRAKTRKAKVKSR